MFDILCGWRKASKCKRLIKKGRRRLQLLMNLRCTIVRHFRDDIAQLLKLGHAQTALDRAEDVFKDENMVAVYDLLDHFCELIIFNLPYILRNEDCPDDISEAASTIIFASARLGGEVPELRGLRKLFEERYGQQFADVALQLLPGNLVNRQVQEKVCLKKVPDEAKSRLLSEIARSPESQQLLASKTSPDPSPSIATIPVENGDQNPGDPDINRGEKERFYFEICSEEKRLLVKHLALSFLRSKMVFPLIDSQKESPVVYHQCCCKKKTDIKVKNAETDGFIFSCSEEEEEEECCNEKEKTESRKPSSYSRAETMPVERAHNDSYLPIRSNSFPVEQPGRSPSNPHYVHPKLPDYNELAAKFTALKLANSQNQRCHKQDSSRAAFNSDMLCGHQIWLNNKCPEKNDGLPTLVGVM